MNSSINRMFIQSYLVFDNVIKVYALKPNLYIVQLIQKTFKKEHFHNPCKIIK